MPATSRSHGPSRVSPGANHMPPVACALRRASCSGSAQQNTRNGIPSTTTLCGTSIRPQPAGSVSGGSTSQESRSAPRRARSRTGSRRPPHEHGPRPACATARPPRAAPTGRARPRRTRHRRRASRTTAGPPPPRARPPDGATSPGPPTPPRRSAAPASPPPGRRRCRRAARCRRRRGQRKPVQVAPSSQAGSSAVTSASASSSHVTRFRDRAWPIAARRVSAADPIGQRPGRPEEEQVVRAVVVGADGPAVPHPVVGEAEHPLSPSRRSRRSN